MIPRVVLFVVVAAGLLLAPYSGAAARNAPEAIAKPLPFVRTIFCDNMVLQRGKANTIWGWSELGALDLKSRNALTNF